MKKSEPNPFLKTYIINLRPRGVREVQAYGFTKNEEEGFIYLHKKDDLTDRSTFFRIKDISGFEEVPISGLDSASVNDEFERQWREYCKVQNRDGQTDNRR